LVLAGMPMTLSSTSVIDEADFDIVLVCVAG
jgi:hypothetical protein